MADAFHRGLLSCGPAWSTFFKRIAAEETGLHIQDPCVHRDTQAHHGPLPDEVSELKRLARHRVPVEFLYIRHDGGELKNRAVRCAHLKLGAGLERRRVQGCRGRWWREVKRAL